MGMLPTLLSLCFCWPARPSSCSDDLFLSSAGIPIRSRRCLWQRAPTISLSFIHSFPFPSSLFFLIHTCVGLNRLTQMDIFDTQCVPKIKVCVGGGGRRARSSPSTTTSPTPSLSPLQTHIPLFFAHHPTLQLNNHVCNASLAYWHASFHTAFFILDPIYCNTVSSLLNMCLWHH